MLGAMTQIGKTISHWASKYYKAFEEVAEKAGAFDSETGQETRSIMRRMFRV